MVMRRIVVHGSILSDVIQVFNSQGEFSMTFLCSLVTTTPVLIILLSVGRVFSGELISLVN